jgi:putative DNA primase/helicase
MMISPNIAEVALKLLGEPQKRLKSNREWLYGNRGSLKIDVPKNQWFDHEASTGGGPFKLVMHKLPGDKDQAHEWLVSNGFAEEQASTSRLVATYDYTDETGTLLFQVCRFDPKRFLQRRPNGNGDWYWNLEDTRRIIYRLPEVIEAISYGRTVLVVEGEKDVDNLRRLNFWATTSPGGASKWHVAYNAVFKGADVVLLPDNDDAGRKHVNDIAVQLKPVAQRVCMVDIAKHWPECPHKGDISDWIEKGGGSAEQLHELIAKAEEWNPPTRTRLTPISLIDFFSLAIKQREQVLEPIVPEKGLVMIYASRGIGKTHAGLGISYAVATGTKFLKWTAPKARKVLLVDGEMPSVLLRERLQAICDRGGRTPDTLNVICGDLIEEGGIGNLADPKVQKELDPHLEGVELLILDNLSSLTTVIRDNDAESWNPIQSWLLALRRRGISVLIIHHAGKGGDQRGTSRREDILDTSISLRRPSDYIPIQGARFEVHIEKGRGILGEAAKPFEAWLQDSVWTLREIDDVDQARVRALLEDGMTVRDIADETGISKSRVHRIKKALDGEKTTEHAH